MIKIKNMNQEQMKLEEVLFQVLWFTVYVCGQFNIVKKLKKQDFKIANNYQKKTEKNYILVFSN